MRTVLKCSVPCSGSAGRVALSREDKEAAKLGLSVFTVNPVKPNAQSWGLEVSEMWGRTPWVSLTTATHVIQHHRVDSEGPSTAPSATRKKPRAEDKAELE